MIELCYDRYRCGDGAIIATTIPLALVRQRPKR